MSDLTEFLSARIAEDELVARAAGEPPWDEWCYWEDGEVYHAETMRRFPDTHAPNGVTNDSEGLSPSVTEDVGPHIARHDPARVLAECEAKRQIVTYLVGARADRALRADTEGRYLAVWWVATRLAKVYADHADYREEWRA